MSKKSTRLRDLQVGDLIYADVLIDVADIADQDSASSTAKKIKRGSPVRRICVVLVPGTASVQVTYVATFHQSTDLPTTLDKAMWYPFQPATRVGNLQPLPPMENGKAQWASLRRMQTITKDPVSLSYLDSTVIFWESDRTIVNLEDRYAFSVGRCQHGQAHQRENALLEVWVSGTGAVL